MSIPNTSRIKRRPTHPGEMLANAKDEDLKIFEISPSGYGIHWPLIDEDISLDALIGIVHKPNKINNRA